jgi:hypothetical protein
MYGTGWLYRKNRIAVAALKARPKNNGRRIPNPTQVEETASHSFSGSHQPLCATAVKNIPGASGVRIQQHSRHTAGDGVGATSWWWEGWSVTSDESSTRNSIGLVTFEVGSTSLGRVTPIPSLWITRDLAVFLNSQFECLETAAFFRE